MEMEDHRKSRKITEFVSLELDLIKEERFLEIFENCTIQSLAPRTIRKFRYLVPHTNQPANHFAEMNFFNLPLELRVMVYENVLQEENHIFRDGLPGLLGTRLQITQEVYKLCEITATVRPPIASLFLDDLDDIKRRVDKFESQEGNKGVTVRVIEPSDQEKESRTMWKVAYSLDSRALEVMKNDMEKFNRVMNGIGTFFGVMNDFEMFYGWI